MTCAFLMRGTVGCVPVAHMLLMRRIARGMPVACCAPLCAADGSPSWQSSHVPRPCWGKGVAVHRGCTGTCPRLGAAVLQCATMSLCKCLQAAGVSTQAKLVGQRYNLPALTFDDLLFEGADAPPPPPPPAQEPTPGECARMGACTCVGERREQGSACF